MKAEMEDGTTFEGDSPEAVVRQMKRSNWSAPERKGEYMQEIATRVSDITGATIRATTATMFLGDLERAQFLKITELSEAQAVAFVQAAKSGEDMPPTSEA
jgi:hypothetical protein